MKKILCFILALVTLSFCFASCMRKNDSNKDNNDSPEGTDSLKLGLGVYSEFGKAVDADGENVGSVVINTTAAALLIDDNGKIVNCVLDSAESEMRFDSMGKTVTVGEYKTKGELKNDYGMVEYGNAKAEWYKQAEAFAKLTEGKKLDELKALIIENGKGNDAVTSAGCTVKISEFIYAIEKAYGTATECDVSKDNRLSLSFVTVADKLKNAEDTVNGNAELISNICAVCVSGKKVTAMKSDEVSAQISFTDKGAVMTDTKAAITSKRELGKNYGMSSHGEDLNGDGTIKEWFEQADAFDKICIGKTADEIYTLDVNGYGNKEVQNAGCTIKISHILAAAIKAVK